jgi:hypothetical protein
MPLSGGASSHASSCRCMILEYCTFGASSTHSQLNYTAAKNIMICEFRKYTLVH